jgi:subtilisin family serine protease/uncharacterized membrane protein YgcG
MNKLMAVALLTLLSGLTLSVSVTIISPQIGTYNTPSILVNLTNTSAEYVWFYNGTANQSYGGPAYVTFTEGNNTLYAYANDSDNNITSANVSFTVDTVAPQITILSPVNQTYNDSQQILVNLSSSSADKDSIWFYNGTANQSYSTPVYINFSVGNNVLIAYVNDSAGNINSSNTSFTVSVYAAYEDDDSASQAVWIDTNNTWQTHAIYPAGDVDWMKFNATGGMKYLIRTSNLSGSADTNLSVYHSDANTLAGHNDDVSYAVNMASAVLLTPANNETYYIKVHDYSASTSGVTYQVSVQKHGRLRPYLISPNASITANQSELFNFSAGVECTGGPCYEVTATLDPLENIENTEEQNQRVDKEVINQLEQKGEAGVIVKLRNYSTDKEKQELLESILSHDTGFVLRRNYSMYNGFAGIITTRGVEGLLNSQIVEQIYYDSVVYADLSVSVPSIRANDSWAVVINGTNITGSGETVCVIDTGINYNHADFAGGVYVGGYDFVNDDADPMDDNSHGSHVAGIIASQDSTYKGVAPGARIAAVKVLNSGGSGSTSDIISGIEWCTNNAATYNISIISMSLGSNVRHTMPCPNDVMAAAVTNAINANISVVIASGNIGSWGSSGSAPGIGRPACIPGVISVGATSKSSVNTMYYHRAFMLQTVAPGYSITATYYTSGHISYSGTSMATPHVSGVLALVQQASKARDNRTLTPTEIKNRVKYNGLFINDTGGTNLTFSRVDAYAAVNAKGVVPMNSGHPFNTITQNPSLPFNLTQGESRNFTWQVNTTAQNGTYEFFAVFEDNVSDYNITNHVSIVVRELVPPAITILSPANRTYGNASVLVNISTSDASGMGVVWFYNGSANQSYNSAVYVNYSEGSHVLSAWANDSLGNLNSTNVSFSVDTTQPSITNISNQTMSAGEALAVQFNATDASGIYAWSVNDTNFTINSSGYLRNATSLSAGFYWLNVSVNDSVNNSASCAIWINVSALATMNSYNITPIAATNGSNVSIYVNFSYANRIWANITLPDSSSERINLTNEANTTYTNTTMVGRYNIIIQANNTRAYVTNSTDYFETFQSINFTILAVNASNSGVNSTWNVYYRNVLILNSSSISGNYSQQLTNTTVDFELKAYSNNITVTVRRINLSSENGKTLGLDKLAAPVSGYLATYGINCSYNFTNATVVIYYGNFSYTNESYLELYKCSNWSFANQTCTTSWANITDNLTKNTQSDYFSYFTTSFSGFSVKQQLHCGDSVCTSGTESCSTCAADCGQCSSDSSGSSSGSSGGGGGGGGAGGSGGATAAKRNVTIVHYLDSGKECTADSGCKSTEACFGGKCMVLAGVCGYAENHTWNYYGCCDDSMCGSGQACKNNNCIEIKNQTPQKGKNCTYDYECNQSSRCVKGSCIAFVYEGMGITESSGCCLFGLCSIDGNAGFYGICWYWFLLAIICGSIAILLFVKEIIKIVAQKAETEETEQEKKIIKAKTKKSRKKSAALLLLIFLIVFSVVHTQSLNYNLSVEYKHPLYASSYTKWDAEITTFRFKIYNQHNSSTAAFRMWLDSEMSWFEPKNLTYALQPDGYTKEGWPYWNIPPIGFNESTEISFVVNRRVGLPDMINVNTEEISKWSGVCSYLKGGIHSSTFSVQNKSAAKIITEFLQIYNQSQNITIYHKQNVSEQSSRYLVYLAQLQVFGVFGINETGAYVVSDKKIISEIVSDYISSSSPNSSANTSKPYEIMKHARELKAAPEKSCMVITGMDRFPCKDRDSCLYACFSVPVCSMIGQAGWSFIDTLLDYKKSIDYTNDVLDDAVDATSVFAQQPTYEHAQNALGLMHTLNTAETKVIFHPLFTSYGFCQSPEYGMPEQIEAKRQLLDYSAAKCLYGEKERIVNESMHFASKIGQLPEKSIRLNQTSMNNDDNSAALIANTTNNNSITTAAYVTGARSPCCVENFCSFAGFESVYGFCWQWWIIGVLLLMIYCMVLLFGWKGNAAKK